jgi:hypothetical protein
MMNDRALYTIYTIAQVDAAKARIASATVLSSHACLREYVVTGGDEHRRRCDAATIVTLVYNHHHSNKNSNSSPSSAKIIKDTLWERRRTRHTYSYIRVGKGLLLTVRFTVSTIRSENKWLVPILRSRFPNGNSSPRKSHWLDGSSSVIKRRLVLWLSNQTNSLEPREGIDGTGVGFFSYKVNITY